MSVRHSKAVQREILLSFWKVHILHHAGEGPIFGQWMLKELMHHGYAVSPGTLYPLLSRMREHGWLRTKGTHSKGSKLRKEYVLTSNGREVLAFLRKMVKEMQREIVP